MYTKHHQLNTLAPAFVAGARRILRQTAKCEFAGRFVPAPLATVFTYDKRASRYGGAEGTSLRYSDKKQLEELLAGMHRGERQKLYNRADAARKRIIEHGGRTKSHDEIALEMLAGECDLSSGELNEQEGNEAKDVTGRPVETDETCRAQVVAIHRSSVIVEIDGEEHAAQPAPALLRGGRSPLVIGDMVRAEGAPQQITAIAARRTKLSRLSPRAGLGERVLAANVDIVAIVTSVAQPNLRPRLIDRILLAVEHGGASPVILATKIDLLDFDSLEQQLGRLQLYRDAGIQVIPCSSGNGAGIEAVRLAMRGKTCVMVGHSGVGKSSLLNALDPAASAITGEVRRSDSRGRHTTTGSRIHRLAGEIRLIDTPGIRGFGLWEMSADDIRAYFHEFDPFSPDCGFADCTHTHEPGCTVKNAVQEGKVPRGRYDAYLRLIGDSDRGDEQSQPAVFACVQCGASVASEGGGTLHRNHCPRCLWSRHLDDRPGDRAAGCGGRMEPVSVWVRKGGEWAIIHRCQECGALRSNRIAGDDNEMQLLSLAVRPLAQPAFRLDAIAG